VQRFSVQDITIGPTHVSAFNTQGGCSDGRFSRITVKLPGDTPNQSAFEIGSGSSNITVEGIRGQTGDDCVAVWAFGTNTGTNTVLHTYTLTLTAAQRSTSDITIRNIDCNIGIVPVRVLGGDGSTIKHVHAYDITNRLTGTSMVPALYVGPSTYVTTDPALGEIDDITMTGYRGPCTELLGLDQACSNVTVIDSQVTKWQKIVGVHAPGAHPIHVRNITIDGVGGTSLQATPSSGTVCQFPAENGSSGLFYPMMVEGLALRNMTLARADAILDNAANITGLHVHNIRVEMMMGTAFRSTGVETGTMDRVSWTVHQGASPQVFSNGPCRLKLGAQMPVIASADVAPSPLAPGSRVTCDQTKVLDGGAATGATYVANRTAWVRDVDLGATVSVSATLPTVTGTLALRLDASQITGLQDLAAVTQWNDVSGNARHATQATAAKQPLYLAVSSMPSGLPAVRFDGVDDWLQTAAFAVAQPVSLFVVCIIRRNTTTKTETLVDGAVASTTSRLVLYKTGSPNLLATYAGTANVNGSAITSGKTQVITDIANGASSTLRVNGSAVTGNPGTQGVNGVTIGARNNTTQDWATVDIGEILLYSGALSAGDQTTIENYLTAKWA
jgi:hypothetical protein